MLRMCRYIGIEQEGPTLGLHETPEVTRRAALRAGVMADLLSCHNVALSRAAAQYDALC